MTGGRGSLAEKLSLSLDELTDDAGFGKAEKTTRPQERAVPYASVAKGKAILGCRVFVGNLPYSASWQDLKDHMRQAGTVLHCDIIAEPGTALGSKGCGIVEYATVAEAQRAIQELSETKLNGRPIFVREDRELGLSIAEATHRPGPPLGGGCGGGGPGARQLAGLAARLAGALASSFDFAARSGGSSGGGETRPGDWLCACGTIVFASKNSCFKCGATQSKQKGGGSCSVFVGNLPYSVTWQDLKDHMRAAGEVVHCDIIAQPGTALGSKGCGLVRYATPEEARRAILTLSETEIRGRPIFVREDREDLAEGGHEQARLRAGAAAAVSARGPPVVLASRAVGGLLTSAGVPAAGGAAGGGSSSAGRRVFVGNLPYSVTWKDLKDHMRAAGTVLRCDILPQPGTTLGSRGCGIVEYGTAAEAKKAIAALTETQIRGRPIFVREDRD